LKNTSYDLTSKVAIVTGAARGMGNATAQKFAEHGAIVIMNDINKKMIDKAIQDIKNSKGARATNRLRC
jgi:3-oxoacyl-[acyl-carrier protein] reductase